MLTIAPARCSRMIGSACLQAITVPRRLIGADAVERLFGDLERRRIAAGDAHPDVVVQDVDPAPAPARVGDRGGERRSSVTSASEGDAVAAVRGRHRRGLLGRGEVAVDRKHARALGDEAQHGGAAVAHPFARALPGTDDDGDLFLEAHGGPQRVGRGVDATR